MKINHEEIQHEIETKYENKHEKTLKKDYMKRGHNQPLSIPCIQLEPLLIGLLPSPSISLSSPLVALAGIPLPFSLSPSPGSPH